MFQVPEHDDRLKNKAQVLTLVVAAEGAGPFEGTPVAIAAGFLERNPVHHIGVADRRLVLVTSPGGANRVYDAGDRRFVRWLDASRIEDEQGRAWSVTESALVAQGGSDTRARVPAQRAFWFGWYNQYPETRLMK